MSHRENMTQYEKERLLSLFSVPDNWCQEVEAKDFSGGCVPYDDPRAVAWDLTGGVCRAFGWDRALEIFPVLERHMLDRQTSPDAQNPAIASMVALQEFNDQPSTSYDELVSKLQSVPALQHETIHAGTADQ